jgi:hypothetical protein
MVERPEKVKSLIGKKFNRLTAFERYTDYSKKGSDKYRYKCKCDCGNVVDCSRANLSSGTTKSCGCYRIDIHYNRRKSYTHKRPLAIIRYYKRNAKTRNVVWDLADEFANTLISSPCIYCEYNDDFKGIDRINNKLGYTKLNSVPCCKWCNFAKNSRTLEEFKEWSEKLYRKFYG